MEITLPAQPSEIKVDFTRCALVVVDMQNAFCKKGGMMDRFGKLNVPLAERVIAADREVTAAFRKKGIKVIYLRMIYGKEETPDSPYYWKEGGLAALRKDPALKDKFLHDGTWGARIIDELKPEAKDIVIDKLRFSGFTRTNLDETLKNLNIKYLFFIGAFTNICVESTLRDAFFHEYFPFLIEDACANIGPEYTQDATVSNVIQAFGWVIDTKEMIKALAV